MATHNVAGLVGELVSSGAATGEAHDIVAALLDVPRYWPKANAHEELDADTCANARRAVERMRSGMPFAYAVGKACFRHLTLDVDERVLIPRPETEVLIDEILAAVGKSRGGTAIDVGTGSGAIAISLACEANFDRVIAIDISADALDVARKNAATFAGACRCNIEFREGSFMEPVFGIRADVVVSNPPYIAHSEASDLPANVREWEPALALFSDDNGMAAIVKIVHGAANVLQKGGLLALEVDSRRASLAAKLIEDSACYDNISIRLDLTGRERFVLAQRV